MSEDIRIVDIAPGDVKRGVLDSNQIIIVRKGTIYISYDCFLDKELTKGSMLLLPQGIHYEVYTRDPGRVLIVSLKKKIQLCERISLEWLSDNKQVFAERFYIIAMHERLDDYFSFIEHPFIECTHCQFYIDLKIKEFLFLLKCLYTKEQLTGFFYPLITADNGFSLFVFQNHDKYRTVQELADASCYSLSAFNKLFRKTFGVSPYKWMQEQKARKIYSDINLSNKPLKEICENYGFSSLSQFSNFCKSQFGISPRKIKESAKGAGSVKKRSEELIES